MKQAFYFGCKDGSSGHFLHDLSGRHTLRPERICPDFPWVLADLDCGLLSRLRVQDYPTGRVYWTTSRISMKTFWHAFLWWDRSGDDRPGSNSGLYVHGFEPGDQREAFDYACSQWPDIVTRQKHPLVLYAGSWAGGGAL